MKLHVILFGLLVTCNRLQTTAGVSLEQAQGADSSQLTLDFLGKIDSLIVQDSYLILEISKVAYEIEFTDLTTYLNMKEEDQFYQDTMVGKFADFLQELCCEQLFCEEGSDCVKFDMNNVFSESDIEFIANWVTQIKSDLREGMQKAYSKENVVHIINGLTKIQYPRLYTFLSEKEIPESIMPYLNEDNDPKINAAESTILRYIRFYMAKAYYQKGLRTVIDIAAASSRTQVRQLVSGEVSCHKPSMADDFDSTFMEKLDQATLFSPHSAKEVVNHAKKIDAPTILDFFKANMDYQGEQKEAVSHFNDYFEKFTCEVLKCKQCRHVDICHVFTDFEKSRVLDVIAFPPKEVINSFSIEYDAKEAYFNMRDILDYKVPGAVYENVKNAFDIDHNGITDTHEMQFVHFAWFVMDYFLAQRAVSVMKGIVFSQTREELEKQVNQHSYCFSEDISDSLFTEAVDSSLVRNHDDLHALIKTSVVVGKTSSPGDYFDNDEEWRETYDETKYKFCADFKTLLCNNYPCQYGGHCFTKPTLDVLSHHYKTELMEIVLQPDPKSVSVMSTSVRDVLQLFMKNVLDGKYGDPLFLDKLPREEFMDILDLNENGVIDDDEFNIVIYVRLRVQEFFLSNIRHTIVEMVNAKLPYRLDAIIHAFTECKCLVGFGGDHCEQCSMPTWLIPEANMMQLLL